MLALILSAIQDNLHGFRAGEYGQPFHYRAGHEMGLIRFGDDVATAAHILCVLSFPRSGGGTHSTTAPAVRIWTLERRSLRYHAERGNDKESYDTLMCTFPAYQSLCQNEPFFLYIWNAKPKHNIDFDLASQGKAIHST